MNQQTKEHGFTVIEVAILVIVIVILGLLGFIAYNQLSGKSKTTAATGTNTSSADLASAKTATQTFYDAYQNGGANASTVAKYGTANLVTAYNQRTDGDPILCGQNSAPTSVTAGTASSDGSFSITVEEKFDTPTILTVKVVKSGSDFKIDSVGCPTVAADTSSAPSADITTQIKTLVNTFYGQYDLATADHAALLAKYGTANAQANFANDQKQCVQNVPSNVVAGDVATADGGGYIVGTTYNFESDSVIVQVEVTGTSGAFKIDSVSCNA